MSSSRRREEQSQLLRERSFSSSSEDKQSDELELDALDDPYRKEVSSGAASSWRRKRTRRLKRPRSSSTQSKAQSRSTRPRRRRSLCGRACHILAYLPYILATLIVVYAIFLPSYSKPPQRYTDLRKRVAASSELGAANPNNEKVFVAASLYDKDGELLGGDWGESVRRLVDILGHDNVFVSVYENDPDKWARIAMNLMSNDLPCDSAVIYEHLDKSELPHVTMPDGSQPLQRIAFLADVRNRALRPLDDKSSKAYNTRWDKLLYINDVSFDPIDAANLLFNTHVNENTGKADYRAACAVDFINPFKFYDTFATRDLDGYDMGVPFYPWFTGAGNATSRKDVLSQTDSVRVKSCWGGMVSFEAKWFQPHLYELKGNDLVVPSNDDTIVNHSTPPLRFRAEPDTYWDASECCLIHADLSHRPLDHAVGPALGTADGSTGIYMNPYVRVAYGKSTLAWLPWTRRVERLYPFIHTIINIIGHRPGFNPRQWEQPGDKVKDRVWQWDVESESALKAGTVEQLTHELQGAFVDVERTAKPGQFCGGRKLLYFRENRKEGESPWDSADVPKGGF